MKKYSLFTSKSVTVASSAAPGDTASKERTLLLVGPRRTGKSSAGNTLLSQGQVFETRGGGASTSASAVSVGRHVTVVDAQGWGSCEDFVPREEKIELMSALSLCGPGPHVVLLVIPLLDFTESEKRVVETRMDLLTSAVWRYTMVLFTFGDRLRRSGRSVMEHIQSGGPAMRWLMEKCCYRYHVMDNTTAVLAKQERLRWEVNTSERKRGLTWRGKDDKGVGRKNKTAELDESSDGQQEQVRELLSKVEDMMHENGEWHFSLHMYYRLEEEWSHKEQKMRAQMEAETDVGSVRRQEETAEMKGRQKQEQRLEIGGEESSLRMELEKCVWRTINRDEDKGRVRVELSRQSSEEKEFNEDGWDTSSDSGVEKEEEEKEESPEVTLPVVAPRWPNEIQQLAFRPIRRLA